MPTQLLPGPFTGRVALHIGAVVLTALLFLPLPLLCQNNACPAVPDAAETLDMNLAR